MSRRYLGFLFVVVSLAACGKPAAKEAAADDEAHPATVELTAVKMGPIDETIPMDGTLVLPEGSTAKLAPAVAGRLTDVRVKEGDRVAAGQIVAQLDGRVAAATRQSAASGATSAVAAAEQSRLSLDAARADQSASVQAAKLALDLALEDARTSTVQAQVDLDRLKAGARPQELAQAEQTVDQARIARDKAKNDADRDQRLLKVGLVAGSQADTSQSALKTAESALKSAQAAEALVKAGNRPEDIRSGELKLSAAKSMGEKKIAQARAALRQAESGRLAVAAKAQEANAAAEAARQKQADARAAGVAADFVEIRSPFAGTVVRRFLNPGDSTDPATPVLTIARAGASADFVGNLSPAEAERVRPGMTITVDDLKGVVSSIQLPDPTTGLVPVRARLEGRITVGGFKTALITLRSIRSAPLVPKSGIVNRDGKPVVYIAKAGAAHQTEVTLGPESNGMVAVLKGVAAGDEVVTLGANELSDNAKVEEAKKDDDKKDAKDEKKPEAPDADDKKGGKAL